VEVPPGDELPQPYPRDDLATARAGAARVVDDLRAELAAIEESTAQSPDDEHDAEGSTVGYERARVGALLRAVQAVLDRLDDALVREREGRYGSCATCGKEIPAERLLALPGVQRCAACATRKEESLLASKRSGRTSTAQADRRRGRP
jgi:DnaK suppressor protein